MSDTYVTYAPGERTLLAHQGSYLFLDAKPGDSAVGQLWAILEQDGIEATLEKLTAEHSLTGFCAIDLDGGTPRVAKHATTVLLDGQPASLSSTLTEVAIPVGSTLMATAALASSDVQLPIESGVVGAGALMLVRSSTDATVAVRPSPPINPPSESARPTYLDAPPPKVATAEGTTPADAADGETVLAAICLDGHYSGAFVSSCRVCGSTMPAQSPRTIARPSLGFLVLATGEKIDLDRGAILGRAPRAPEGVAEEPHLVNLAAFGRDVSRQHAEVIVQGWNVFAQDLGSANGTRLFDESGTVTVLEPGVPVPWAPSSTLEIAEVTRIEYRTS